MSTPHTKEQTVAHHFPVTRPIQRFRSIGVISALVGALLGAGRSHAQERAILDAATFTTTIRGVTPPGTLAVEVAEETYPLLSGTHSVSIFGFALTPTIKVDLDLERFWAWGPGTQFVIGTDRGDVPMKAPSVAFFRGTVGGEPGSRVFLSASPSGLKGIIRFGHAQYFVSPAGPPADAANRRVHWVFDGLAPEAATPPVRFECKPVLAPGQAPPIAIGIPGGMDLVVSRVALVAIDADFEMRQKFATVGDAALYVCELMAAVSIFYETDINMKLAASYIRIWDTAADPYTGADTEAQLPQFKNYWEANMGSVPRNAAHLVSGRNLGGGLAYVDQMCGGSNAYGVSGNMSGSFPRPPQSGSGANWDLVVVAHELGHNFGSPHTHCYSPPIDLCYTGEDGCAGGTAICQQGTIMSYCHTCTGGLANIDLTFGPVVSSWMQSQLVACIGPARNPCFVNAAFSGTQQGTSTNPMRTVARGTWYVFPGGTVSIVPGNYPEQMTICQPMRLTTTGGVARIGQ